MDKNAIKKYATWARRELISRVSQKAEFYGVTAKGYGDFNADSIDGRVLSSTEKEQRQALIHKVRSEGYEQAMEEVAYTWFNRFSALRYMEVNNYFPTRVRVFTNENGEFKPQIIDEAIHLELDGLDMEKVYSLKDANDTEALYRYLLITQCNALSKIMPVMFQKIDDYTELLLPDYLLREGSVIEQMVTSIPEEDWTDQVQIIGWLYQYYNAEKKDEVFAALKKNVKITKENIPAATQLFTPDWIVRYMVENSLGRLWVEGHPNEQLKSGWKYYLEEAEQEADVEAQLAEIRKEYAVLKPEEILCIDPCAGSGHILDYLFDILMQIYTDYGYTTSEAVRSIVENNLYGLDIDERAAQLAYFSVMMKARSYDRRFLTRKDEDGNPNIPQPYVYAIVESNHLNQLDIEYFTNNDPKLKKDFGVLVDELHDAKEYGSILNVSQVDFVALYARMDEVRSDISMYKEPTLKTILPLIQVAEALAQKYHVVCTNPPYMGSSGMGAKLGKYVKDNYPDSKSDLFAVFIERCGVMTAKKGYQAMITQHAWMFLSSFEKLRGKLLQKDTVNMAHLGPRAFEEICGEVVQTTSFVLCNGHNTDYKGTYCRLIEPTTQQGKEHMFLTGENRYTAQQSNFAQIPGSPVAYWISENYIKVFEGKRMSDFGASCIGMRTGDNERFLRFWFEVSETKFGVGFSNADEAQGSGKKWFPYCKGGSFRKWYGNNDYVVNWENNGFEIKENTKRVYPYLGDNLGWKISNESYYFKSGLTWSGVGARVFGVRAYPSGMIFDSGANSYFVNDADDYEYFAGLLNCNVINNTINIINPTINTGCGVIAQLPAIYSKRQKPDIKEKVIQCIDISHNDWDAFETSWDFKRHPLIPTMQDKQEQENSQFVSSRMEKFGRISWHYDKWVNECADRFAQLKANEEELNRIFINIYGLQDELAPEVEDKDVTVRLADKARDIRSFISYAVGCMFGRYSLDVDGLAYAGGEWDASKYSTYIPDKDGIIPICDDEYFEDDIANRFVDFVRVVYGKNTLEENLKFIADALGGKGAPRQVIRNYFMNDFYADHLKVYQKRPIYWLFDSGRKNGFKCLIYIHRYKPDTIARIRTDYVHEQQARYRTAIAGLENQIANAGTGERVKLNKQLKKLQDQADELHGYEEKIHHLADQFISIDLDDGVKHNYEIFKDVLAKIK
ncbi:MAG: BREX-1 system adenine-specific DNA-methyltransferase PglX [Lachnospiraceae bacterium]|nr:BREX-1 system adenine-specific DNA-methyltransferase PglX [Lachnospiraceae bacterium]